MKTGPKPRSISERFSDKYIPEALSGCWLWTGAISKCGYGRIGSGGHNGVMLAAHRVAWEIFNGVIPHGMEVAHTCDVRICVNPSHLWLATHQENMADMEKKGRGANDKTDRRLV